MKTTHQKSSEKKDHSDGTPKEKKATPKRSDAMDELENEQQTSVVDSSYSEQQDLTPPKPHPFPSFGIAETDFVTRDNGRTTGRMIDDEPGI